MQSNEFDDRVFNSQLNAVFADVNDYQDRLHYSRLARVQRAAARSRKFQRRAIAFGEGIILVAGLSAGALLITKAASDDTPSEQIVTPGASKEVAPEPMIDPSLCDFSPQAMDDPGLRISEYRECDEAHRVGLPGVTD